MNFLIHKIEYINGSLKHTPIGYATRTALVNIINNNYNNTLGVWLTENKSDLENGIKDVSLFFQTTPVVYVAKTIVTSSKLLSKINDI